MKKILLIVSLVFSLSASDLKNADAILKCFDTFRVYSDAYDAFSDAYKYEGMEAANDLVSDVNRARDLVIADCKHRPYLINAVWDYDKTIRLFKKIYNRR